MIKFDILANSCRDPCLLPEQKPGMSRWLARPFQMRRANCRCQQHPQGEICEVVYIEEPLLGGIYTPKGTEVFDSKEPKQEAEKQIPFPAEFGFVNAGKIFWP